MNSSNCLIPSLLVLSLVLSSSKAASFSAIFSSNSFFLPLLSFVTASKTTGKAWHPSWSVIAIPGMPHDTACLNNTPSSIIPSICDIIVWACNSTLFLGALSFLFIIGLSIGSKVLKLYTKSLA